MDLLKKTNKDILNAELSKLNEELDNIALKKAKIIIALRDLDSIEKSQGGIAWWIKTIWY